MLAIVITAVPDRASALKLASWNMEHLADTDGEGCRPRNPADYEALKRHAAKLDADVIAVQEVENEQALGRVFNPEEWSLEIARNPDQDDARSCTGMADKFIITQRTGFAIRKTVKYSRNPDLTALDIGNGNRHRYGVDITLEAGAPLRLLSVHLKSGCPAAVPGGGDNDCQVLFEQQKVLKKWVDDRAKDAIPFMLLGDFNRRLQAEEQFWTGIDAPGDPLRDLHLPVRRDTVARCQPAFPQFIDFIVFNPASFALFKADSFQELVYEAAPASDHCPIAVELTVPDLGDAVLAKGAMTTALKWYRRSAEFPLISRYIYEMARQRVDAIRAAGGDGPNWVVSLDADETIFDNSLGQLENEYLGLGFVAERWRAWEMRGAAKEIPGAIDFVNYVLGNGGKIAIISNRDADLEEAARQNLVRLGMRDDRRKVCILGRRSVDTQAANGEEWQRFGYKNDKDRRRRLLSEDNAAGCWSRDTDGSVRASWSRPHKFVLWIGDNILDLPKTTQAEARTGGTPDLVFGRDYFLLPNPLYGSWQNNKP
ncbi:HAD family acid phosphatase [Bradyrhizobium yuanmingense]|uniref:HAD family acid phosphatase n=1 Tax=Bradyrhizobium yuanmingense TaxID=108015 RepID=UPI0023B9F164|nr:HAD family acid phosphatase [Bradyrhizobium yuanmingense]MDF0522852.1 HAD family acid phosphatase [Bradyrhizobium yuanmingense]